MKVSSVSSADCPRPNSWARLLALGNGWAWVLALGGAWLWTWRYLATEWRLNEQYNYGYAVPWLAGFIAWRRWREGFRTGLAGFAPHPIRFTGGFLMAGAWLLFLFGELLRRQDPTWRLVGWSMTLSVGALTAVWLYRCGGSGGLRAIAFALGFAGLALPWPSALETPLTLGLGRIVTGAVASLANLSGIAAVQRGNVIELSRGVVGIATACSGVESFQATLMVAVFLGEFYRVRWPGRLGLVGCGWVIAFAGNIIRVYLLTWAVASRGEPAAGELHDPVGYTITGMTFLGLWAVAAWTGRKASKAPWQPRATPQSEVGQQPRAGPTGDDRRPGRTQDGVAPSMRLGGRDGYLILAAVLMIPLVAKLWFATVPGSGSWSVQTQPLWTLRRTGLGAGWKATALGFAPAERALLRFSEAEGLWVRDPADEMVEVFHFFWKPGAQVPSQAFSHSPEICMPSAGWEPIGPTTEARLRLGGASVPFRCYRFRFGSLEQTVLHASWYGGRPESAGEFTWTGGGRLSRLAALWHGPFRRGHEALTLFVPAVGSRASQVRLAEEFLGRVLAPGPAGVARATARLRRVRRSNKPGR